MRRRPTLGVLVPHVGGFYFANLLSGIRSIAGERGARVVAFQTTGLDMVWAAEPSTLPLGWDQIDGWIGIGDIAGTAHYERIALAGTPLVTVSARLAIAGTGAILPDNHNGTRDAVRHLIGHGHRRIAFAGALNHSDIRERHEGYLAALREAGIAADPALFFPVGSALELDGRELGKHLVSAHLPCTALVAGTDWNALGIAREVQAAGYRVPEDLAIIGFDDVEPAQYANPPLATVRQPFDVLASRAAEVLLARILDGTPMPNLVRVPALLLPRQSCGCSRTAENRTPMTGSSGQLDEGALAGALLHAVARERIRDSTANAAPAAAARIAAHLAALLRGNPGLARSEVRAAWGALLAVTRGIQAIEVLFSLLDEASIRDPGGPPTDLQPGSLGLALGHARADLMLAWRDIEQRRLRNCDSHAEANHKIDLALIGADFTTSQDLSWLRWARVRMGVLGEWKASTSGAPRRLLIRNVYPMDGEPKAMLGSEHLASAFPSSELCDLLEDANDILSIVPITGHGSNPGLLAVIGPIETETGDETGNLAQWAALLSAAMYREELLASIRKNALHDALTGLPNRALLMDRLEQAIARAQRTETRFAVLFMDLDGFKTINDSLGHIAGDQLLVQIAHRLGECLRATDTFARLGGDEFAIVVTDLTNEEAAFLVAERLQEALRAPFEIGEHRVFTSASVGITTSNETCQRPEDYLRDADMAMYRAKSQGRAHHQLFDGHMHKAAMERLSIEADIRRALERDEFVLHYQPVIGLDTGEIIGVEALIRWRHPDRGFLPPAAFLPVAEESGLILSMSEWVMRTACEKASQWQRDLPNVMRISINVPPQQLKDPRFVGQVRDNLRRTGLAASGLGLELLEGSLVETGPVIDNNLQELRAMGIYVAIDDFGTGYSSLSYLKRLPIDALKIDRSFTQGIPSDANDVAISTTIIAMARSLKLSVVAEGVETRDQMEFLRRHGCDAAQGYLFSRPLPADECFQFFKHGRYPGRLTGRPAARASAHPQATGSAHPQVTGTD
jgi:diguanylate cyclase (GGDEF)-like protein